VSRDRSAISYKLFARNEKVYSKTWISKEVQFILFCEVRILFFSGAVLTGCVLSSVHLSPTLE
jgi:hypothetical protein